MRTLPLVAMLGSCLVAPVQAADAQDWLSRLAAAEGQSFHGSFVYERNGSFSSHGIWHRVDAAGGVRERLLQLDGPAQEVVRVDGRPQCLSGGLADQLSDVRWPAHTLVPAQLAERYEPRVIGHSRVAGREAVVLALMPRDQHRYAVELHLDEESALPLKSLLISEKGQLLERFQFIDLDTATALSDDQLRPGTACKAVDLGKVEDPAAQTWRAGWLPPGFQLQQVLQRRSPASAEQVAYLTYDDGLARFSVFLEPLRGAKVEDARSQLGPTAVVSRRMSTVDGDVMVTVVGEIPLGTAERVALSMQAVKPGAAETVAQ